MNTEGSKKENTPVQIKQREEILSSVADSVHADSIDFEQFSKCRSVWMPARFPQSNWRFLIPWFDPQMHLHAHVIFRVCTLGFIPLKLEKEYLQIIFRIIRNNKQNTWLIIRK